MTDKELQEELDRICVDDLDSETKRELIVNGFARHQCDDPACPFCTLGPMQFRSV